jgi:NADH-quinone oxidoreductase subunit E
MTDNIQAARSFRKVIEILDLHHRDATKIIPILQAVQEEYRYLPQEVLTFIATSLGMSPARVFGVATFYSHFSLEPKGKHILRVCDGTACHVKGSTKIINALREKLGLTDKKRTTPDMQFTLETVSCLGACGLAPVLVIDDEVHGQVTSQKAVELVETLLAEESNA